MISKIKSMTNEEYEAFTSETLRLQEEIDHTSLLMNCIREECKCPFCHSVIESMDKIRENHLQKMREYNEFIGRKYYVSHVEGAKKWEI